MAKSDQPWTEDTIMPFGAKKGMRLGDISDGYLETLYRSGKTSRKLKTYIEQNVRIIILELEMEAKKKDPPNPAQGKAEKSRLDTAASIATIIGTAASIWIGIWAIFLTKNISQQAVRIDKMDSLLTAVVTQNNYIRITQAPKISITAFSWVKSNTPFYQLTISFKNTGFREAYKFRTSLYGFTKNYNINKVVYKHKAIGGKYNDPTVVPQGERTRLFTISLINPDEDPLASVYFALEISFVDAVLDSTFHEVLFFKNMKQLAGHYMPGSPSAEEELEMSTFLKDSLKVFTRKDSSHFIPLPH